VHLIGRKFEIFEKFRKNFMALNKRDDNAVIEAFDINIIWYFKSHDENVSWKFVSI